MMFGISRWSSPLLLLGAATITVSAQKVVTGFDFEILEARLPKPLSDITAVSDANAGKVYVHGGCDSVNGNKYNAEYGEFTCTSVSLTSYVFDLKTKEFSETAPMPVERYRHAAVLVNNQVWLLGGRDVNDTVIPTVDVRKKDYRYYKK